MSVVLERAPVLRFDAVTIDVPLEGLGHLELEGTLRGGDLWLIQTDDEALGQALIDAATGLTAPRRGAVRFLGHDWAVMPDGFRDALRGRIGLIPRRGLFLPYADLAASTLIAARFHRTADDRALVVAADGLARRFGLPGLARDASVRDMSVDALRAACVRAFLGEPSLVLVESRPLPWTDELLQPLVDAMQHVRDRGGSVIWCLQDDPVFDDAAMPATERLRVRGRRLQQVDT